MRLLYVTNGFPYPLTSGYLRHYFLIRELSQRHSITLFSLVNSDFSDEHVAALSPYTDGIEIFRRATSSKGLLRNAISGSRALANLTPALRSMWGEAKAVAEAGQFDIAFFSGKFTLPSNGRLGKIPVVADLCDAGSIRIRGRIRLAGIFQKPLLFLKYVLMRRLERSVMRRASHSVFVSCRDRDALTHRADCRTTIVPNGVDLDYWKRSVVQRAVNTIVFTGAMNYGPNLDAALFLIQQIFPRVKQLIPAAELLIVGRDPGPRLLNAASNCAGVKVTGYVEDIRPYLERGTVFAAPLRFASGIQNKVLEAMAMEMHIIVSPAAVGGVRTEDGRDVPAQVVEGAEDFARAIIIRLNSRNHQLFASNPAAREYVEQHFGWRQSAEKLEHVLNGVARPLSSRHLITAQVQESMIETAVRKAC